MAMSQYTESSIRQNVLDVLQHDTRIDASGIHVDVHNGTVYLTGSVPTYYQKIVAGELASKVKGVVAVQNNLTVTLAAPQSDAEIAAHIRSNLVSDARIDHPERIDVRVANGVVTLTGTVDSYVEKSAAESDAWTVPGVVEVVNNLTIVPPVTRSDVEIAERVRKDLASDPALDASHINVNVCNGVVTLTGTVPTYYQRKRAESDVWSEPGVRDVVDNLTVAAA
jgi:osmotically-inducible protein OsmY